MSGVAFLIPTIVSEWFDNKSRGQFDVKNPEKRIFLTKNIHANLSLITVPFVQDAVMFRTFPMNWARTSFSCDDLNGLSARY